MKKSIPLKISALSLTALILTGCSQEPAFTATTAEEFERQHYQAIEYLTENDRERYELSIATLILFTEDQLEADEISDEKHLTNTASLVRSMTPSGVVELASRPEYEEYRELALQLIVYGNTVEWEDETSQDILINVNDLSDIEQLERKRDEWEQVQETLRRITLLDTSISYEDGARSYHFTLENNTSYLLHEATLTFSLVNEHGISHNENQLSYAFPTPLSKGETHQMAIRESRPQLDVPDEHYAEERSSEGVLRVAITSLLTDDGVIGGDEQRFTEEDQRRLNILITERKAIVNSENQD